MSARRTALRVVGVATGAAAGLAGAVYGARRAVGRGLRRRPDPGAEHLASLLARWQRDGSAGGRHLDSHDGGTIRVYEAGPTSGPPLVLSHGVSIDSRVWVCQLESLPAAGFRVIAFDHRGHGCSVAGSSGHSIENLASDLRTVLEGLDLRDAVLVGHSMGGAAVQALASQLPDVTRARVRGLVLLSSLAKTQVSAARRLRATAETVSGRLDLARVMASPELGTFVARLGFGRAPAASQVELARRMLAECSVDTSREAVRALLGLDLTPDLDRIDRPTLVIGGTADLLTPPWESRRLARGIPGARLVMLEGAGHMIMLERAAELEELLVGFARDLGLEVSTGALPRDAAAAV